VTRSDTATPGATAGIFFCDWEGSSDDEVLLMLADWATIPLVVRRALKHIVFIKRHNICLKIGVSGSIVVKALRYMLEGRGFENQ
jgi:hypothetical protein